MKTIIQILFLVFLLTSCRANEGTDIDVKLINGKELVLDVQKSYVLESGFLNKQYTNPSLIELNDGSLLMATVSQNNYYDASFKEIVGIKSYDKGLTWTDPSVIQENIGVKNTASPTLIKLDGSHVMLFFISKNSGSDLNIYFKESFDDGNTWTDPKMVNAPNSGYHIVNNDRVKYHNGRLWIPVAHVPGNIIEQYNSQKVFCFYSDDLGVTWHKTPSLSKGYPLMEPGITILSDNEILMNIRTRKGTVLFARSTDYGKSWKFENSNINSPASPQTIHPYKKSDTLMMVWNNTNKNHTQSLKNRNPLSLAYSTDKGKNWILTATIENNNNYDYSYAGMFSDDEGLFINYHERSVEKPSKASLKGVKIKVVK